MPTVLALQVRYPRFPTDDFKSESLVVLFVATVAGDHEMGRGKFAHYESILVAPSTFVTLAV